MLEVDLADGVSLKDAYGEFKLHPLAKFTVGHFKKPFSRLKLTSPWDLLIPERGLLDRFAVSDAEHGGYGGRDLGVMLSGKWDGPVGLRYHVGVFNNFYEDANDRRRDYVARLELELTRGLSLAVNASHKLFRDEREAALGPVYPQFTRNLFGADASWKFHRFTLQAEAAFGVNIGTKDGEAETVINGGDGDRLPVRWLYGVHAIAAYRFKLGDDLSLTPAFMAELFDPNTDEDGDHTVRLAGAVNLDLGKAIRFALAAEGVLWDTKGYDTPTSIYLQVNLAY
jgi:hypothetical protein